MLSWTGPWRWQTLNDTPLVISDMHVHDLTAVSIYKNCHDLQMLLQQLCWSQVVLAISSDWIYCRLYTITALYCMHKWSHKTAAQVTCSASIQMETPKAYSTPTKQKIPYIIAARHRSAWRPGGRLVHYKLNLQLILGCNSTWINKGHGTIGHATVSDKKHKLRLICRQHSSQRCRNIRQ